MPCLYKTHNPNALQTKNTTFFKVFDAFTVSSLFFVIISLIAIYTEQYYLFASAFAPLILYYSIFKFEYIYYFIVFFTPFSVNLDEFMPEAAFNISMPTEILLALMVFILLYKFIKNNFFNNKILKHPVSVIIVVYLLWTFVTTVSSSMPMVSFKNFAAKLWFVLPLYFFPLLLFKDVKNISTYFYLYIIPFAIVIVYTISNHLSFGVFDKQSAHFVMQPFYNDHTSYGAMIAMYIPVIIGLFSVNKKHFTLRLLLAVMIVLFTIAIILSYTRAAWISILGALVLWIFMELKIKLRTILLMAIMVIGVLFSFRVEIIDKLSKNKQDSSAELSEHVKSISNIATDASNMERINRWKSALKMFKERPFLGWGGGTYMFQYAPFQQAKDRTIISTNFGEVGNAHSEYISPLVEQGVFGLLIFLALIYAILQTAFSLYSKLNSKILRIYVLASILSLSTYFIHGLLNNYLDTDKASVPFWGMTAVIVSIDLYNSKT